MLKFVSESVGIRVGKLQKFLLPKHLRQGYALCRKKCREILLTIQFLLIRQLLLAQKYMQVGMKRGINPSVWQSWHEKGYQPLDLVIIVGNVGLKSSNVQRTESGKRWTANQQCSADKHHVTPRHAISTTHLCSEIARECKGVWT